MALAAVLKVLDFTRRKKRWKLSITPSGNYVAGGDTLDLTKVTNPSFLAAAGFGVVPDEFEPGNNPGGYPAPEFVPGATLQTCKLKYFGLGTGAELAAGAYPAALTGDPTIITLLAKQYRG